MAPTTVHRRKSSRRYYEKNPCGPVPARLLPNQRIRRHDLTGSHQRCVRSHGRRCQPQLQDTDHRHHRVRETSRSPSSCPDGALQCNQRGYDRVTAATRRLQSELHSYECYVEILFLNTLPKRLALFCIDNDAYNGSYAQNPFHAKNSDVNFLAVYVDGRHYELLQPNFPEEYYVRSCLNMFSSTGKVSQDDGNGLIRVDFSDGYTFFGFGLIPNACDSSCFHLLKKGNWASRIISHRSPRER